MEENRVRDILIPLDRYPCVARTTTLRQAVEELQKHQIVVEKQISLPRTVLVFSENRRELCGMVRRRDILRGLEPSFLVAQPLEYRRKLFDVDSDPNLSEISYDRMISGIRQQANRPVSEVMIPIKATVDHEDHLMKAIREMVDSNTSMLPVLKNGEVIGVVRSVDVLNVVARIIL